MITTENSTASDLVQPVGEYRDKNRVDETHLSTRVDTLTENLAIVALLFAITSLRNGSDLPDPIPSNFDAAGTPTTWHLPVSLMTVLGAIVVYPFVATKRANPPTLEASYDKP